MLTLRPSPPQPIRADAGRAELVALWDGLDRDGRRLVLSHARAVAEVRGRVPLGKEPPETTPGSPTAP
ncbi:hypothetical protein ACE7GA_21300 [Roseomonas sp. CCTCC AB2023176]|uniref:hypothetical protein n=1 Tax=Roseomonas sp. CCTCC AB2023176 TaxID=3342640 RepID=UPI0035E21AFC